MLPELRELDELERVFVRRLEQHRRGGAGGIGLFPTRGAQAPSVSRLEPREPKLGSRCGEIVSRRTRERKKILGDAGTDAVDTVIVGPGAAAAVAVESGQRIAAALEERSPKYVL